MCLSLAVISDLFSEDRAELALVLLELRRKARGHVMYLEVASGGRAEVVAGRNPAARLDQALAFPREQEIDEEPRRRRMRRLRGDRDLARRGDHRVERLYPFDRRAVLLFLLDFAGVDQRERKVTRDEEARQQAVAAALLRLLPA